MQIPMCSGGDTSQWPKSRPRSEYAANRLRMFWIMLPSTRLLCPTPGHAMQRVLGYADRKFSLACGCTRGVKL